MLTPKTFHTITGRKLALPVFFPDATRAVLKSLDTQDIESTHTQGILVNTYHLFQSPGKSLIKQFGGIRPFMNWTGATISDSGGFQVMSMAKTLYGNDCITDRGVVLRGREGKKLLFTPKDSIDLQIALKTDLVVVLDDFTPPTANRPEAAETVKRTILWAKQCKEEFTKQCQAKKLTGHAKPYLIGVVQGGDFMDLRADCAKALVDIGFDGLGWGGWPVKDGKLDFASAEVITKHAPKGYLLYGLGVGKPEEIKRLVLELGWHIFDCVLPTRDARHKRLYVYNAPSIDQINLQDEPFYTYFVPDRECYYKDSRPVSTACDCLLCQRYSRAYLAHLFRIKDMTAGRLATIHNLRFYSILMEKLRERERAKTS